MNAVIHKFLEIQKEFFAEIKGKVMPSLPHHPNPDNQRYDLTIYTCMECYPEKEWEKKLGIILTRHGIDLSLFIAKARERIMNFSLKDGNLFLTFGRCPKIWELLEVIAELIPEMTDACQDRV